MTKIFFSHNAEWSFKKLWKMIYAADANANVKE